VTSSVKNAFGAPSPPSGTAVFYMRMQLLHPGDTAFHDEVVNDTVTSPILSPDHTYTLNVYHFFYNEQCPSSQCTWTMNVGSPTPGSRSLTFAAPLSGATVLSGSDFALVWQFVQN
jgi:hypothetical protein